MIPDYSFCRKISRLIRYMLFACRDIYRCRMKIRAAVQKKSINMARATAAGSPSWGMLSCISRIDRQEMTPPATGGYDIDSRLDAIHIVIHHAIFACMP